MLVYDWMWWGHLTIQNLTWRCVEVCGRAWRDVQRCAEVCAEVHGGVCRGMQRYSEMCGGVCGSVQRCARRCAEVVGKKSGFYVRFLNAGI